VHHGLDGRADAVEAVVHMGAVSSTTETDAGLLRRENVRFPLALWRWCAAHCARLIYASSAATYGDGAAGFDDDGSAAALARLRPLNPYGFSKLVFDRRVARLVENGALRPPQWVGLRFFNVYGPGEGHKGPMRSVVVQVYEQAAGGSVRLFRSHRPDIPDGGQKRDFIAVADCAKVVLWLLDNPAVNGLFNLGTGVARSFEDLARATFAALGEKPAIVYVDTPPAIRAHYQYFTEAKMARLRGAGFIAPFTRLEDGVADYVKRYLVPGDPYP
jgi:ADP-L-glycero-D-manno-heptose 6-epimerase